MGQVVPPLASGLDDAVALIGRRFAPAAILLYGSAARGELRRDSDIDIGILFGSQPPDAFELASTRTDVEARVGRDVDLVVLDTASPILSMEVLREHRVLLNRAPEIMESFIVKTLGAYFDLKRVRRPIEEALRRPTVSA